MRSRWIIPPSPEGWADFVFSEWELRAAGFSDHHPHTETNLVVEGELHVEANGVTVIAGPGDTVRTPAGVVGRYWAPTYARMVAVYGPNPDAESTEYLRYWDIKDETTGSGCCRSPKFPRVARSSSPGGGSRVAV
jgi:hypothetical protein